jgi:hypothetical protein
MTALSHRASAVTVGPVLRRDRHPAMDSLHCRPLGYDHPGRLVVLAAIFISAAPAESGAVPSLSGAAQGNTAVVFDRQIVAADLTPITTQQSTTPNGITLNANGTSFQTTTYPGTGTFGGGASASATINVGYGSVGADATASENLSPLSIGIAPSAFPNPFDASAGVKASGYIQDTFVLSDPSLPLDAPLDFVVSGTLDAPLSGRSGSDAEAAYYSQAFIYVSGSFGSTLLGGPEGVCYGIGIPNLNLCTDYDMPHSYFYQPFTGKNGEVVSLNYGLAVTVEPMSTGSAYGPSEFYGEMGATIDAVHTVNVDPTTTGESILSASGHDYSTVPEPPSTLLAIVAMAGCTILRGVGQGSRRDTLR